MNPSPLAFGPALVLLAALTGCATVRVGVTTYVPDPDALPRAGDTVAVYTATEPDHSALASDLAAKVEQLLEDEGLRVVEPDDATYVAFCDFVERGPRRETRLTTRTTAPRTYRTYYHYRRGPLGRRGIAYQSTYVPSYTYDVPVTVTLYNRGLHIALHKAAAVPATTSLERSTPVAPPPIWRCDVVSESTSADTRWIANHLLVAAFDYFAVDTERQVTVERLWSADAVEALANGPAAAD